MGIKSAFCNEVSNLAETYDADMGEIIRIWQKTESINNFNLNPGLGWSQKEFGDNFNYLSEAAERAGIKLPVLTSTIQSNYDRRVRLVQKAETILNGFAGKNIGILGLTYKPFIDDITDSPGIELAENFVSLGATVRVHDPVGLFKMQIKRPDLNVQSCYHVIGTFEDADMVILVTEWPEYNKIDWFEYSEIMRNKNVFDARNFLDKTTLNNVGIKVYRFGSV